MAWQWLREGASLITSRLPMEQPALESDDGHWVFGNATYIPKDLRIARPQHTDRPYASYMYAGAGYSSDLDAQPGKAPVAYAPVAVFSMISLAEPSPA
ncbi:lipid A-modifier LpxR family protein [Scleromatobacter humisilvae]|uniref:Lipid A deacylase LpxR family protein n=1 Tax=Scleromatobacter humisilvae TaxID=2897159 RepID=A0A9X1YPJ0_9BURK|nr:lipid A deacylase LpxR family protein [Scleromatobacter humisilvae]